MSGRPDILLPRTRGGIIGINTDTHLAPTFHVDTGNHPPTREGMLTVIRERVKDPRVIAAFERIDRKDFVPESMRRAAYSNEGGLLIREGLILSQPTMMARMTEGLRLKGPERVLYVGAGTGYGAAIVAQLVEKVDAVEIDPESAAIAEWNLRYLGIDNVTVHRGDGRQGLRQEAPFDAIMVTAASEDLPDELLDQLAPGGRLLVPVVESPYRQRLLGVTKGRSGHLVSAVDDLGTVNFGPLLTSTLTTPVATRE